MESFTPFLTTPEGQPYAIDETLVFDEHEFAEFLQMSPYDRKERDATYMGPPQFTSQTPLPVHLPPHQQHHSHQPHQPQLHQSQQQPLHQLQQEARYDYYEEAPPIHLYPPESSDRRPQMSLSIPQSTFDPYTQAQQQGQVSPFYTPGPLSSGPLSSAPLHSGSSGSQQMTEYFPPFTTVPTPNQYLTSPTNQAYATGPIRTQRAPNQSKTGRQQFSACGACRHRRVKCDLKEKQDKLEREPAEGQKKKAACTNCEERGVDCVDEYAPLKAAKQLRRGKRISEIEVLYGKPATAAARGENIKDAKGKEKALPELSREFFDSAFFRRFQVQRPVLDPQDFVQRYLSAARPCAALMGAEGAVLCHVIYAWAVSYGVDEHGRLDVPEGGGEPLGVLSVAGTSENELRREADRQRRMAKTRSAVQIILNEIDEIGILRKPTWDGVRVLLLILPLTEGVSTPVERLAMYEAALNQVYALCSFGGMGYDGQPAATSGVNGGVDNDGRQNVQLVRVRIYWYAFVHEGITTGLKGGRLHLDDEDLETMQDTLENRSVVVSSTASFRTSVKFATAPIHLALACRLINRALTGPSARRSPHVNGERVKQAWEALERSWEEFESLKYEPDAKLIYKTADDVVRFADGWKIFLFEAQNVIRRILEERLEKEESKVGGGAYISQHPSPEEQSEGVHLRHLLDISKSKCEIKARQILDMVRLHVGSRFFEWDASLVRDGTFYAAKLLSKLGGTDEDMGYCLQALNELRWAHAKASERSAELRSDWAEFRQLPWDPTFIPTSTSNVVESQSNPSHSGSASPLYSPIDINIAPYSAGHPSNIFDAAAMARAQSGISMVPEVHPPGLGQLYIQHQPYPQEQYTQAPIDNGWIKTEPSLPPPQTLSMQSSHGVGAAMRGYPHTASQSMHANGQYQTHMPMAYPPQHVQQQQHQQQQQQHQQQHQQQQLQHQQQHPQQPHLHADPNVIQPQGGYLYGDTTGPPPLGGFQEGYYQ